MRGHRGALGLLALTSVLGGVAEAGVLAAIAQLAAMLLAGTHETQVGVGPLNLEVSGGVLLAIACGLSLARMILLVIAAILPARIASSVQAELRTDLFSAFTRASWAMQSTDREGYTQEMLTSQVQQATQGTLQVAAMVATLFTTVALVLSAMALNVIATLAVIVMAAVLFGLLRPLGLRGQRYARELSRAQLNYASAVGEAVRMAEEDHVFGVGDGRRRLLRGLVEVARERAFRTQLVGRLVPGLFQGLIFLTIVIGLGALYVAGAQHVASLGAVVLLLVRAGTYGQQIQSSLQVIRQALPFVERLREATEHYRAGEQTLSDRPLGNIEAVSFADVSYAYRVGHDVLSDISFDVVRGEALGIIGPSGAGKSTLVQIVLGLRSPDCGTYSVNGQADVRIRTADWHRQVAYLPQDPRLLHASVAENIRYFRDIDDDMVERAAILARIHDEIVDWRDGYDTVIGPRADSVSGGQKQRICLARALASRPTVLVLDEPTSALDPGSQQLIQKSLRDLSRDLIVILVTHRMSALALCDRVMVIVDGRVEALGEPADLESSSGYYGDAVGASGHGSSDALLPRVATAAVDYPARSH